MKTIKLLLILCGILLSNLAISQSPEGVNYQATVRNSSGVLMTNQTVSVIFTIKKTTATGTTVYSETQSLTTNAYGGFSAVIGKGTPTLGTFSLISWATNKHFLNVKVNGNDLGTTQLMSVPYALYAKTSGSSTPGPQGPQGPQGIQGPPASDNQNIDSLTVNGNTLTVYIENGNSSSINIPNSVFENASGVVRNTGLNSSDDFVFGSPQLNDDYNSSHDSRMFFDKSKGSFRTGIVTNKNWDTDSLGDYSFASGYNTKAIGSYSTAMGRYTVATGYTSTALGGYTQATGYASTALGSDTKAIGNNSTAMGYRAKATGYASTALGRYTVATGYASTAMGRSTQANGCASLVVGRYNDTLVGPQTTTTSNTPLFVVGNGISTSNLSNAFTVLNNGKVTINDTYTFPTTDGSANQQLKTDGAGNLSWENPINTVFENASGVVRNTGSNSSDDFVFGSPQLNDDYNSSHDSRMFFDKSKGSFRTGIVTNKNWDTDSIGTNSFASGNSTKATGDKSTAMGDRTIATGYASTALGGYTQATGDYSIAMGRYTQATGDYSIALGKYNKIYSGLLFALGNGTSAIRANAMEIYSGTNNVYFAGNLFPMVDNTKDLGSPSHRWNDVYATSGVVNTSDTTQKTNMEPLPYGLNELMKIKTIRYNWKNDENGKKKIGFNAQNLLQLIPEVIVDDEEVTNEETGETTIKKADVLGVYYSDLIPVLTKSIQEQQVQIEKEKSKTSRLEAENKAIKKQLNQLQKQMEILLNKK